MAFIYPPAIIGAFAIICLCYALLLQAQPCHCLATQSPSFASLRASVRTPICLCCASYFVSRPCHCFAAQSCSLAPLCASFRIFAFATQVLAMPCLCSALRLRAVLRLCTSLPSRVLPRHCTLFFILQPRSENGLCRSCATGQYHEGCRSRAILGRPFRGCHPCTAPQTHRLSPPGSLRCWQG